MTMAEVDFFADLERLLRLEMQNAERAMLRGTGYVFGLGLATERSSGLSWHRQLVLPSRGSDVDAKADAAAAAGLLRRSDAPAFGQLHQGASSAKSQYIVIEPRSGLGGRILAWCNADRESSSGFAPSILRQLAFRSAYFARKASGGQTLPSLLVEACENLLLGEASRLILEIDPSINKSVILWRYDSARRRLTSLESAGLRKRQTFEMPLVQPDASGSAHGVVALLRPELPHILYDSQDRNSWAPAGIDRWAVRNLETWRDNRWRSVVVYPLTSAGLLTGAVSIYTSAPGRRLLEVNRGLRSIMCSTLQGALRSLDEANRLDIMESRFDQELERLAISLKVVAHAHDLGNTVDALKKSIENVRSISGLPDHSEKELLAASESVERVRELTRLITDPAKAERRSKRSRCDVGEVVTEFRGYLTHIVKHLGGNAMSINFKIAPPARGYTFRCAIDPLKLERILDNLVNNAIVWCQNASPRGSISVRVSPAPLHSPSEGILIEVEDNGSGIPAESRPFVFDRFFSGRSSLGSNGMGLGLYLTKKSVLEAKGHIRVESRPGQTTFSILLPHEGAATTASSS